MSSPEFRATYRIVRWASIHPRTGKSRNPVVGSLEVARRPAGAGCVYEVAERRNGHFASEWRAAVTCSGALRRAQDARTEPVEGAGDLDEAVRWTFESSVAPGKGGGAIADLALSEEGTFRGGVLQRAFAPGSGISTTRERVAGPLVAQWSLPHVIARGAAGGATREDGMRFAMLADCSVPKPEQTLWREGEVEVPTAAGVVRMDCYAQIGRGVLPIHYLVDSGARVQLVTQSDTNWALESVG
jgi:hypothetical protein